VSGVVRDWPGAPIRDATVSLGGQTLVTKDDGRFLFEGVGPGSDTLTAYADGLSLLKRTIVGSSDIDLGDLKLVLDMHGGVDVALASESDCWGDAGDPPLVATRLYAKAIEKPMPVNQSTAGMARVKILVGPSGLVACSAAIEGDARLAGAALTAARQWRFPAGAPFMGYLDFRFSRRGTSVR
jgi:hypothetical protein